jgi:hypothetical protein
MVATVSRAGPALRFLLLSARVFVPRMAVGADRGDESRPEKILVRKRALRTLIFRDEKIFHDLLIRWGIWWRLTGQGILVRRAGGD